MKNQVPTLESSLCRCFAGFKRHKIFALMLTVAALPAAVFADATWVGGTSQDWNDGSNWNPNPPGSQNYFINTSTAGVYPILGAAPSFTPVDLIIGDGANSGQLDQSAGTLALANTSTTGNWMQVARNGGTGTYNLTGNGSLAVGKLWVGGFVYGENGIGTVNIDTTGSVTANSTDDFSGWGQYQTSISLGWGATGNGTLNLQNGTVNSPNRAIYVGTWGASGTLNQSGGTINAYGLNVGRWFNNAATVIVSNGTFNAGFVNIGQSGNGGDTIQGTMTVNSNGIVNSEGDFVIGLGGSSASYSTVNINTGGVVNVASTTKRWLFVGQYDANNATLNVNGGSLNLNANTDLRFSVGGNTGVGVVNLNSGAINGGSGSVVCFNQGNNASVNNTFNLNGGTLTIGQIVTSGSGGTRAFNFNGGTLKASASSTSFFAAGVASSATVQSGGAIIDTAGNNITIGQALLDSGGGLTKTGNGTLTLTGANTFSGAVVVNAGTLYANIGNRATDANFSYVSGITVNTNATLRSSAGALFGWDGSQAKPITVNAGGTMTADAGGDIAVGTVTLNGGTLAGGPNSGWGSWSFGRAAVNQLVATDNSAVTATNMAFYNGASIDVAAGKTLTISGTIDNSYNGASSLIKSGGTGTLVLSGANTYTGNTTINTGTLALGTGGSISNSANISVAGGAIFDVSVITFTMGSQTLTGAGNVNGNVATASSAASIQPGIAGVGTLTFNNNLNLSAGGSLTFELSTTYNSGNDQVVVGGNLSLGSSDTIHISALGGSSDLDTNADYILFLVTGTTTMATTPTLVWDGTTPGNYLNFSLKKVGNNVVLHYSPSTASTITATASPSSATRNQAVTITATVTPGTSPVITAVNVDLSQIGGSSTASLVLSNNYVYTNTFVVTADTATGSKTLLVTATDTTPLTSPAYNLGVTINTAAQVWDGAAGNNNWTSNPNWTSGAAPGLVGDSVTFAGTTRPTPNMDTNYSVTGLTFDSTTGSFVIGTANSSTLTLTANGIVNNSVNAQTVNVPIVLSASETINASAGDVTLAKTVDRGGNTLTVSGAHNTVVSNSITGSGELWLAEGTDSQGTLNVASGATVTVSNWVAIGRDSGNGTLNVNGGTFIHAGGGNISCGTLSLGTAPIGTINLNSGSISNLTGETYLGEGSADPCFGFYNQSGGTASLGNLYVGRGDWGGSGIGMATVSGGILNVGNLEIGLGNNNTRIGTNVMTIGTGATVNASGFARLAFAGSANLLGVLTNSGTLNVGSTALYLSYWPDGCSAHVVQNGGALNLQNNASIIFAVNGFQVSTNDFVQNGGIVTFYSDAGVTVGGTGSLNLCNAGAANDTYTLAGGTLTVPQIQHASGSGTSTFNFSGGTLKAAGSSTTFMQGLTVANVMASGATIDTAGNNITIAQALLDGGGNGGLTKTGNGTLVLSGANTYTGNTTISAGTLELAQATLATNSTVSIASSAKLKLDFSTTNQIGALVLNGVTQSPGLYNSTTLPAYFSSGTGSLIVPSSINPNPPQMQVSVAGSTMTLAWPTNAGWILQQQTNSLSAGLGTNWVDVSGSANITSTNITINPANPAVFYRLRMP